LKLRITSLAIVLVALVAIPALAQNDIYDNGPINGTVDAWTINFGFIVSDTFTIAEGGNTVNGLTFGAWLFPGDILQSAEVSITSSEFGGTTYFDGVVNFTQSGCTSNQFGFDVCNETGSFDPVSLSGGTYWLNLQNAVVNTGDPVYWDENGGPSSASENSVGTIPSEAFTILGGTTTTTTSTTPEPSSILLLGSGLLGMAGLLRRKLF
jgi:PEP-CTERM motif-containing protein